MSCINGSENYANLYLTKLPNGQRLYVFECCQTVTNEAYDTTDRYPPMLDTKLHRKEEPGLGCYFCAAKFYHPCGRKICVCPYRVHGGKLKPLDRAFELEIAKCDIKNPISPVLPASHKKIIHR